MRHTTFRFALDPTSDQASVTMPKIGTVRVHDDTRRLRRLLRPVERLDPGTGR
jgi:hypothetical protein